ncbi:transmembrane protein 249 isoform X2 [Oncorhynchus kisutch]|uniref:transmembrane protein 249 isoform X2 n=1 Tax=Oncorhynchus kisutch TaxID=8019 RepID=UPI0012DF408B|nr:transmembrane protein 249 isoform X2 [Oncorhynchus kisutch]XP_031644792.1 transmembrane protein 249 isoform X2 [Oncorhynchus kisutch]XP_046216767.1 transmembrane protein 249-like isoform X2 [Oncorhynchus gorbuscha]
MTIGIFGTWDHQFNATEQALTDKIKNNPCYPFTIVKDVFVLEYLHENIWKGSLLLIASTIGTACYMNMEFGKEYRYYIHTHLRHRGPLHQIYIRMIAQKSGQVLLMYKLMLNGYKIEERELSGFSEKYELLECQGRRIATKLNLNYFDYQDTSKRHLVIHRPKIILSANNDRNNPPV